MSTQHQINVKNDSFSPKATDVSKSNSDSVVFVQSGTGAPSYITVTAPEGTDASTLFGTTTCDTGTTSSNAPVYTVQSTAIAGVTYTLNIPAGVTATKDTGSITVNG